MVGWTTAVGMTRCSITDMSGLTKSPPLKAAIGVSSPSGSTSIDMPFGGRPLVTAKRMPAARSFWTAAIARSVSTLSFVTSVPSTSASMRRIFGLVTQASGWTAGAQERSTGTNCDVGATPRKDCMRAHGSLGWGHEHRLDPHAHRAAGRRGRGPDLRVGGPVARPPRGHPHRRGLAFLAADRRGLGGTAPGRRRRRRRDRRDPRPGRPDRRGGPQPHRRARRRGGLRHRRPRHLRVVHVVRDRRRSRARAARSGR